MPSRRGSQRQQEGWVGKAGPSEGVEKPWQMSSKRKGQRQRGGRGLWGQGPCRFLEQRTWRSEISFGLEMRLETGAGGPVRSASTPGEIVMFFLDKDQAHSFVFPA